MRCPTCTTDVPDARFCNRCGAVLRAAPERSSGGGTEVPGEVEPRRTAPRHAVVIAVALLAVVAVGALSQAGQAPGEDPTASAPVTVPGADELDTDRRAAQSGAGDTAAATEPFVPSPSATVLCSDLAEHRVKLSWFDDPDVGDAVDLHGSPCIVTAIDEEDARGTGEARPRFDFPRGIARGNRPGTGPTPRP